MKLTKSFSLSKSIDFFFANLAVFCISFIWARYCKIQLWTSIYISTLATLCVYSIVKLKNKSKKIGQLNQDQISHMQECINQLMLNMPQVNLDFFEKVFLKKFENTIIVDDFVSIKHNGISTVVFLSINPEYLSETQLCQFFAKANNIGADKMLILTSSGESSNIKKLISHLPDIEIDIYNDTQTYKMLKAFGTFPDINTKLKKATKISKLSMIALALSPKNAKKYLMLSFVFIVYSYFFGNPTYYLTFAGIALILALACKLGFAKQT
ncbi:MAG: hypothetical protein FWF56_05505 [Firmicutes bacterium]|nr:hypothetical protein [Bacillota bacterium]MCL1953662.1 hypothetical protein [Bacillota bacterium]